MAIPPSSAGPGRRNRFPARRPTEPMFRALWTTCGGIVMVSPGQLSSTSAVVEGVADPARQHAQDLLAVAVAVARVGHAGLYDALPDRHRIRVALRAAGIPGQASPVRGLYRRFTGPKNRRALHRFHPRTLPWRRVVEEEFRQSRKPVVRADFSRSADLRGCRTGSPGDEGCP